MLRETAQANASRHPATKELKKILSIRKSEAKRQKGQQRRMFQAWWDSTRVKSLPCPLVYVLALVTPAREHISVVSFGV